MTPIDAQPADPHGPDEWTQRVMQNMKRMSLDEDYRRLIAKSVSSAEEYAYVGGNPLSGVDPMGLSYFAYRPLQGSPWLGVLSDNPLDDAMHAAIFHEELFFEDGKSPSNLGFFGDGTLKSEPNPRGYRPVPGHYDDCVMRMAVQDVKLGTYHLIGNNCQDWAGNVQNEYKRLLNGVAAALACHK